MCAFHKSAWDAYQVIYPPTGFNVVKPADDDLEVLVPLRRLILDQTNGVVDGDSWYSGHHEFSRNLCLCRANILFPAVLDAWNHSNTIMHKSWL